MIFNTILRPIEGKKNRRALVIELSDINYRVLTRKLFIILSE